MSEELGSQAQSATKGAETRPSPRRVPAKLFGSALRALRSDRTLTVATAVFVATMPVVLAVSFVTEFNLSKHRARLVAVNDAQTAFHLVIRDLYKVQVNYGQDPNSPFLATVIEDLSDNRDRLNRLFGVFENGGMLYSPTDSPGRAMKNVRLKPLAETGEDVLPAYIDDARTQWAPLDGFIGSYLRGAHDIKTDPIALDHAIVRSMVVSNKIAEDFTDAAEAIEQKIARRELLAGACMLLGIALSALYIVFLFLDGLLKSDRKDAQKKRLSERFSRAINVVGDGVLFIGPDLRIRKDHSDKLQRMLGLPDPIEDGASFIETIGPLLDGQTLSTLTDFLAQMFNGRAREKLMRRLNPLQLVAAKPDPAPVIAARARAGGAEGKDAGRPRFLSFSFSRVVIDGKIDQLIATVADVTEIHALRVKLEDETERFERDLRLIDSMLSMKRRDLKRLMILTKDSIWKINQVLKRPGGAKEDLGAKLAAISEVAGALRDAAANSEFGEIEKLCVDVLSSTRDLSRAEDVTGDDFFPIAVSLERLLNLLIEIDGLCCKIDYFGPGRASQTPKGKREKAEREGSGPLGSGENAARSEIAGAGLAEPANSRSGLSGQGEKTDADADAGAGADAKGEGEGEGEDDAEDESGDEGKPENQGPNETKCETESAQSDGEDRIQPQIGSPLEDGESAPGALGSDGFLSLSLGAAEPDPRRVRGAGPDGAERTAQGDAQRPNAGPAAIGETEAGQGADEAQADETEADETEAAKPSGAREGDDRAAVGQSAPPAPRPIARAERSNLEGRPIALCDLPSAETGSAPSARAPEQEPPEQDETPSGAQSADPAEKERRAQPARAQNPIGPRGANSHSGPDGAPRPSDTGREV